MVIFQFAMLIYQRVSSRSTPSVGKFTTDSPRILRADSPCGPLQQACGVVSWSNSRANREHRGEGTVRFEMFRVRIPHESYDFFPKNPK